VYGYAKCIDGPSFFNSISRKELAIYVKCAAMQNE
jgi:hypothetical protein